MGNDLQKGTTYATGGVGGQGSITSANLNAHVDDATLKATCISARADRVPGALTDNLLLESGGALYKMLLSTLQPLLVTASAVPAGSIIQAVAATPYTANANLTPIIPFDDTIPQNTEGAQILTLSITPRFSNSQIRLIFNGIGTVDGAASVLSIALFRSGNANALKTTGQTFATAGYLATLSLDWIDAPASTSSQTYTIRVGAHSGNARMNGNHSARFYGGSASCTLVAEEIKV